MHVWTELLSGRWGAVYRSDLISSLSDFGQVAYALQASISSVKPRDRDDPEAWPIVVSE